MVVGMNIDSSLEELIVSREYAAAAAAAAANSCQILLKTPPTQEMCIMIQAGEESSFDEFLKAYLPSKTLDAFKNRPLEEKVALTYSIVSYYNQLAAGIQQPPPSHLNFLRLDKAPPLTSPGAGTGPELGLEKQQQQPLLPTHAPGIRRLPNITTFNSNSILDGPASNAPSAAAVHRPQNNWVRKKVQPCKRCQLDLSASWKEVKELNRGRNEEANSRLIGPPPPTALASQLQQQSPPSSAGGGAPSDLGVQTPSLPPPPSTPSSRDQDLNSPPRKPGRPSKKWPRCARYSGKYVCGHCSKGFPQQSQLDQHLRVHTGEKPYPCLDCDARFKQLCHLKQHIRAKHTGERPYKCRFCEKSFVQMCHLQQHERSSNHSSTSQFLLSVAAASQVVVDNTANNYNSGSNNNNRTNSNNNHTLNRNHHPTQVPPSVDSTQNSNQNPTSSNLNPNPQQQALAAVAAIASSRISPPSSRISPSSPPLPPALNLPHAPVIAPPPLTQSVQAPPRHALVHTPNASSKIRVP